MKNAKLGAVFLALLAAVFYALNAPLSKLLLAEIPAAMMAALLYLGAGIGVGVMYCFHWKKEDSRERRSNSGDRAYFLWGKGLGKTLGGDRLDNAFESPLIF